MARTLSADFVTAEAVRSFVERRMSEHAPNTTWEKEKREEGNTLERHQRHVALECLGDGARTLGADVVDAEAVYAFPGRK